MEFLEEYGSTIAAVSVGTVVGGIALGLLLYYFDDAPVLEQAHKGFGG